MAKITDLSIGTRVKCIFDKSPFFERKGTVTGFEYDGWIRVVWDDNTDTRVCHPNDVEIIRVVDYDQLNDMISDFRDQVIGLYRRCTTITNASEALKESLFIEGLNCICAKGGKK